MRQAGARLEEEDGMNEDARQVYRRLVDEMLRETDPVKAAELEEAAREAWLEVEASGWGSAGLGVR